MSQLLSPHVTYHNFSSPSVSLSTSFCFFYFLKANINVNESEHERVTVAKKIATLLQREEKKHEWKKYQRKRKVSILYVYQEAMQLDEDSYKNKKTRITSWSEVVVKQL